MRAGRRRWAAFQAVLLLLAALAPLARLQPAAASPGDITAYAGGGLGVGAPLKVGQDPWAVAAFGTRVYVSDYNFDVVRIYDSSTGQETVVAGTGVNGSSGNGVPATQAQLAFPQGLAVDGGGDLFIADTGNSLVREVTPDGVIHTYAGSTPGDSGDGGPATSAQLNGPTGLAVDASGNLYIVDSRNWEIREVLKSSGKIVHVAGNTSAPAAQQACDPSTLCWPSAVVVDASGAVLIADQGNNLLRKLANGQLTDILKDPAIDALALDASGNLFVANGPWVTQLSGASNPALVQEIAGPSISSTSTVTTYAGGAREYPGAPNGDGGPANGAILGIPTGLAVDASGNLLIADWAARRVRSVAPSGQHIINTVMGTGDVCGDADDGSPATSAQLCPDVNGTALNLDGQGNLLIGDSRGHALRRVNADGTIATVLAGLRGVNGATSDGAGGLYAIEYNVQSSTSVTIHHVDSQGVDHLPAVLNGTLVSSAGAAVDSSGNLYVGSRRQVVKLTPGTYGFNETVFAGVYDAPYGVACAGDGGPALQATFTSPQVLGFDSSGDLYLFDASAGESVREITTDGKVRTLVYDPSTGVSCGTSSPPPVAINGLQKAAAVINQYGDVYILTYCTVYRVTAGVLATVKTTDGCSSMQGGLGPFWSIAVDSSGFVYLGNNEKVWKMEPYPAPSAPLSVGANGGIGQATVSWQPPASNGGSAIGGYIVIPYQDGTPLAPVLSPGAGTSVVVGNLTHHSYTFTVRAINGGGAGPPSTPSNPVMVKWIPSAPASVTAKPGDGQALVSWTAPADDGGLPITRYDVTTSGVGPPATVPVYGSMATVIRGLLNFNLYTFSVRAVNAAGPGPAAGSGQVMPQLTVAGGNYRRVPIAARILDTRSSGNRMGPGSTLTLPVLGRGGVPSSGVSAVILNVTATGGTRDGYLSVYPTVGVSSSASTVNWRGGQTVANLTVVQVSRSGSVTIFNAAGWVDVVVDVDGYFGTPLNSTSDQGLFQPEGVSMRLLDTRSSPTGGTTPVGAGSVTRIAIPPWYAGGTTVGAVLNLTATDVTAASYLTAWPDGETRPGSSNLNVAAGQTISNRVIVPVGSDGAIDVFNAAGSLDLIVDLNGWFLQGSSTGSRFTGVFPQRIFDSRVDGGPLTPDVLLQIPVAAPATALVLNVTVTGATAPSFISVYADYGPGMPPSTGSSDLNFGPGQTVANLVVVAAGYGGNVDVYNVSGSADVIVDVVGYFGPVYSGVPATPPAPTYKSRH